MGVPRPQSQLGLLAGQRGSRMTEPVRACPTCRAPIRWLLLRGSEKARCPNGHEVRHWLVLAGSGEILAAGSPDGVLLNERVLGDVLALAAQAH